MNIESLNNRTVGLVDLRNLTAEAPDTNPVRVVVALQELPLVIYKGIIFPRNDGILEIDLHDIVKDAITNAYDFFTDDGYDEAVVVAAQQYLINIKLEGVADVSVRVLECEYIPTSHGKPWADALPCPDDGLIRFQFPIVAHQLGIFIRMSSGEEIPVDSESRQPMDLGDSVVRYIQTSDLPRNSTTFQVVAKLDNEVQQISPVYQMKPGDWQHFYFRDEYGIYQDIPMCGKSTDTDEFKINTATLQGGEKPISTKRRRTFTQESGPLTNATYRYLLHLLETSSAIYLPSEDQVVVTKVNASRSTDDDVCSLSFDYVLN